MVRHSIAFKFGTRHHNRIPALQVILFLKVLNVSIGIDNHEEIAIGNSVVMLYVARDPMSTSPSTRGSALTEAITFVKDCSEWVLGTLCINRNDSFGEYGPTNIV